MSRKCQACGKKLGDDYRDQGSKYTFCSKECTSVNCVPCKCQECGKTFLANGYTWSQAKYCSKDCRNAHNRKTQSHKTWAHVEKQCIGCGKTFRVRRSIADKQEYCSRLCFVRNVFKPKYGADNPKYKPKVKKVCKVCGKEFETYPSRDERKQYCSTECSQRKVEVTCLNCGKSIALQPSRAKDRVYCSVECQLTHQSTLRYDGKRTSIENAVAGFLSEMGIAFWEQYPIAWYSCDFYLPGHEIIIECDGDYWHSLKKSQANDKRKDKFLAKQGYIVVRLPEHKINHDPRWCKTQIRNAISRRRAALR